MCGWEPATTTTFTYGPVVWWKPWTWRRVLATTSTVEPEYSSRDVALLLAAHTLRAELDENGIPLADALAPENQYAFDVPLPVTNWATRAIALAQKKYYEQWPNAERAGQLWRVRLKDH